MNPEQTSNENMEMTPESAKASLGIATRLMDGLMPQQTPEMATEEGESPLREQYPNMGQKAPETEESELGEIKSEIKELRQLVEEALNEDDNGQERTEESVE